MAHEVTRPAASASQPHASPLTIGESAPTSVVSTRHLVKHFSRGDAVVSAVDDVSIDVRPGEFLVLLGPSGCGKTTLLRSIAGLEHPEHGEIEINGQLVFSADRRINVDPDRRHLSMVFQSYALWPHMSILQNVAYPLTGGWRGRRERRSLAHARAREAMELVGITDLADQYPGKLSGGQQQRVALARALVSNNNLVLFDEPLSNVDAKVRQKLRLELVTMQRELGFAAIYVTHDQIEAMEMADRVAVMRGGKVAQVGTPREVYENPATRYVSSFIGSSNEVAGKVVAVNGGEVVLESTLGTVAGRAGAHDLSVGDDAYAVWRPERAQARQVPGANVWRGSVHTSMFLGSHTEHVISVGGLLLRLWTPDPAPIEDADGSVWVSVDPSCVSILPAG